MDHSAKRDASVDWALFPQEYGYRVGSDYSWRRDHLTRRRELQCVLNAQRSRSNEAALNAGLRDAKRDFCQRHLVWWVGDLADKVAARSDAHPLLQASLRATKDFIAVELQSLGD